MRTHYSWLVRFYVSASVAVTAFVAGWDPTSQHRRVMLEDGHGGAVAIFLLAAFALAALVDLLINDLLPERFSLRCTHRHRHVVFMLMAIGQVGLLFALAAQRELRPSAARYLLDALVAIVVAVAGVRDHYRQEVARRTDFGGLGGPG